jgi:hypothetical protein
MTEIQFSQRFTKVHEQGKGVYRVTDAENGDRAFAYIQF